MTQPNLEIEWQKLCEEHKTALDAYNKISAIVYPKMAAIAQGTSQTNPTYEEESKFDNAMHALINVQRRMNEFINKHLKPDK